MFEHTRLKPLQISAKVRASSQVTSRQEVRSVINANSKHVSVIQYTAPDLIDSGKWMHHSHLIRLLSFRHQVRSHHKVTARLFTYSTTNCRIVHHNITLYKLQQMTLEEAPVRKSPIATHHGRKWTCPLQTSPITQPPLCYVSPHRRTHDDGSIYRAGIVSHDKNTSISNFANIWSKKSSSAPYWMD